MLGALALMRQPFIDVLVLGLPLSTLPDYGLHLEKTYKGKHTVPKVGGEPGEVIDVEVRKVAVLPQPAAALLATVRQEPHIKSDKNLVIDIGYFTLDFLGAQGIRPLVARSGAVEGGMAGFFDALHEATRMAYVKAFPGLPDQTFRMPHQDYEKALEQSPPILETSAGPLDLSEPIRTASAKFDEYLDAVAARVNGTDDFRNVILAGGGAALLESSFRSRFPRNRQILVPKRPQIAIANGLLSWAEILAPTSN
jgi:plasmid segregation protein ParM